MGVSGAIVGTSIVVLFPVTFDAVFNSVSIAKAFNSFTLLIRTNVSVDARVSWITELPHLEGSPNTDVHAHLLLECDELSGYP